jgi:hypothetical protein
MKTIFLLLSFFCFAATGCVNVKEATITESTFNTAGWKSNAGGADQAIEATNTPSTQIGQ